MNICRLQLRALAIALISILLLISSQIALAGGKSTGDLTPTGTVRINNSPVSSNVTVVSDSRIVTTSNSSAVANLGSAGQIFILENTDLMLSFEQTWVKIELFTGSVRVQSGSQSVASVITRTCGRVEVLNGTVMVLNSGGKKMDELKTGEDKIFMNKQGFASNSMISSVDYRVSINNCQPAAATRAGAGISRRAVYVLLGAAGAGAVAGGVVAGTGGSSSGNTPPPSGGGTSSSPSNP